MWTTDSNHGAQTEFHTGRNKLDGDFPTLGGWVHYGLGSLNDNLPQFISLGFREYWNRRDGHYLGPAHDAVPLRIDPQNPLDFGRPERPFPRSAQDTGLDLVQELNGLRRRDYPEDPALDARIASYELAFRMQRSVPEVVDFSQETAETQALYGLDQPHCRNFGMQLLAARRFVERGVRFIQIQHGGGGAGAWDAHGGLKANHTKTLWLSTNRSAACWRTWNDAGCWTKRWWFLAPSLVALLGRKGPMAGIITFTDSASGWRGVG
jgi:hypothetical protein